MNQEGIQEDSQLVIPWRLDLSLRAQESHQLFGTSSIVRERNGADSTTPHPSNLTPEVTIDSGHSTTDKKVIRCLLDHAFCNSGDTCYLNSVILNQLWSMVSHNSFTPSDWDEWGAHLLSFLTNVGWQLADLVVDEPFRSLHSPWLTAHPWGTQ